MKKYSPLRIILFGSLANDNIHEYRDIDLVVIKNTEKNFYDRFEETVDLLQENVDTILLHILLKKKKNWKTAICFLERK